MKGRGPVWLGDDAEFPPAEMATEQGLLAIGGDLRPERLLAAYERGIFPWPWYDDDPMLWWCPDPRFVLHPGELHVSDSLEQRLRSGRFEVLLDTAFPDVMRGCATAARPEGPGTWITDEMLAAYTEFHRLGYAHSAESWRAGELVGGLYGVALGGVFFGESMFYRETDASKVAFAVLVRQLDAWGFRLVDCQLETGHLRRFGAHHIPRSRFLREVGQYRKLPHRPGPWRLDT